MTNATKGKAGNGSGLRTLMVSTRAFPYAGGVETHIHEVAPRLARSGIQVSLATTDPQRHFPSDEWIDGVHIRRFPAWPATPDFSLAPQIYRTITREPWDLVHCQGIHTLVPPLAMIAAWRAGIPYIVTLHSGGHSSQLRALLRIPQWSALRPLLARAAKLVAVSHFEADFFGHRLKLPASRFVVIPNGSDLPAPPPRPQGAQREPLILSVGRLERYKGHHRVIAALPSVLRTLPQARLRIVGSGPYEGQLRRLAQELGVSDRVEFQVLPAHDRAGMASLLSSAGVLVLLSEYESQSITVMEALAAGCPVLGAQTSALHDLARDGWIQAVPLRCNADQIASAIIGQLRQPIPCFAVGLPRWDDSASDLCALYQQVASERPPRGVVHEARSPSLCAEP